ADWSAWNAALDRGHVAVADYKGRLCYSSADPAASRIDVRGVAAIAAAYQPRGSGMSAQVLPADDPTLVASRLVTRRKGLELVFARAAMLAGVPQAVFVQLIDGDRLLEELAVDPNLTLALVAPNGAAEGGVPEALLA